MYSHPRTNTQFFITKFRFFGSLYIWDCQLYNCQHWQGSEKVTTIHPNKHAVFIISSSPAECCSFCHHGPHFLTAAVSILTGSCTYGHVWLYLWDFTSQMVVSQGVPTVALWCQEGMFWGLQNDFWQEYGIDIDTRFITCAGEKCKCEY